MQPSAAKNGELPDMHNPDSIRRSKFLSYVLRHKPEAIGLSLDREGWASVDELVDKAKPSIQLTHDLLLQIVNSDDKRRFVLSADGTKIRARHGHSKYIDLGLKPSVPPQLLFHGTADRFLESIKKSGLEPGRRRFVHLTEDPETAKSVGKRYGKPIVLAIQSGAMHAVGLEFFSSGNGIWLVKSVPSNFVTNLAEVD